MMTCVKVDELSKVNVGPSLASERWELGLGKESVKQTLGVPGGHDPAAWEKPLGLGPQRYVKRAVVVKGERKIAAGNLAQRPGAKGCLKPETPPCKETNFGGAGGCGRLWGQPSGRGDHAPPAESRDPLRARPAFTPGFPDPGDGRMPKKVRQAAEPELASDLSRRGGKNRRSHGGGNWANWRATSPSDSVLQEE